MYQYIYVWLHMYHHQTAEDQGPPLTHRDRDKILQTALVYNQKYQGCGAVPLNYNLSDLDTSLFFIYDRRIT